MTIQSQDSHTFYSGFNVATTGFIYNEAEGNGSNDGWFTCKNDNVVIQTCVATKIRSQNVIFRVEGRFDGLDRSASLLTIIKGSTHTIDRLDNIIEKVKEIRVGVKSDVMPASPLGSPIDIYSGAVVTDSN